MGNPLPIVLADMRQGRAGVVAVVALIALAVAIGVAVSAQERALRSGSTRAADPFDLIVGAPGSETQLVLSTVYLQPGSVGLVAGHVLVDLANDEGVAYAAPVGFGDSYRGYPIVGTSADLLTRAGAIAPAEGRLFERDGEAVVGAGVALGVGDSFVPNHGRIALEEDEHRHGFYEYRVVGRMAPTGSPWDRAIVVPIESIWYIHDLPSGHAPSAHAPGQPEGAQDHPHRLGPPWDGAEVPGVPAIVVKPRTIRDAYVLRTRYRSGETMALFPAEVLIRLYGLLGDARTIVASIAVATQVLVVGAVLLAVFAALEQRRRRLAVLRALGASRGFIFAVIWSHVVVMVVLGASLGLGLGWLGAVALSKVFAAETGIALAVTLSARELGMVGALVAIGLGLAAIPALTTYRRSVSAGLRT